MSNTHDPLVARALDAHYEKAGPTRPRIESPMADVLQDRVRAVLGEQVELPAVEFFHLHGLYVQTAGHLKFALRIPKMPGGQPELVFRSFWCAHCGRWQFTGANGRLGSVLVRDIVDVGAAIARHVELHAALDEQVARVTGRAS